MQSAGWQFSIDVGGTFTDCMAIEPSGTTRRLKLLSTGRLRARAASTDIGIQLSLPFEAEDGLFADFEARLFDSSGVTIGSARVLDFRAFSQTLILERTTFQHVHSVELDCGQPAPVVAMRFLMGMPCHQQLQDVQLRLGTTRGTNALLTRQGAKTALLATAGFADALDIGNQQRPDLFALNIQKPKPLYQTARTVDERIDSEGEILRSLNKDSLEKELRLLREEGFQSLAVCLLHSYRNPTHELQVGELATALGFENVSLSHQVSPLIKYVPRASTTVLDAYLNPILQAYLSEIQSHLGDRSSMLLMTSSGGLVEPDQFSGKDSILSGPAGGVVGFADAARRAGYSKAIGFDMGGTSTDVSRLDGELALQNETRKAGVDIQTPVLAIETVAAGGGSICWFGGGRLQVGPQSAGAEPGPACYGRGGPLTVTDLNVFLGRVPESRFPFPLDRKAIELQLAEVLQQVQQETHLHYETQELARAFLEIADSHMANAVNTVSTRQGADPTDYVLVGFGGAAGQHLCGVADCLGIRQILLHPDAGILSAYGIGQAAISRTAQRSLLAPLNDDQVRRLPSRIEALLQELPRKSDSDILIRLQMCVQGTQQVLTHLLDWNQRELWNATSISQAFWTQFQDRFGYRQQRPVELMDVTVECRNNTDRYQADGFKLETRTRSSSQTDCLLREEMVIGQVVTGPVVIAETHSTTYIAENWQAEILSDGQLLMRKNNGSVQDIVERSTVESVVHCEPHRLELFHNRLTDIATQMGLVLQATCTSVNVKERLDFSCAVFDPAGNLLVNAPHIPVHLGAMSETVRHTIRLNPVVKQGQHFVTNDPFQGGSHLPDVTMVSPVFLVDQDSPSPDYWVASRAHHAEIGGITPGSMPPFSKRLVEEGVLLRNILVEETERTPFDEIQRTLSTATYPSRNVNDNLLDLQAQLAANRQGIRLLQELCEDWTPGVVAAYAGHVQDVAEQQIVNWLQQQQDGHYRFEDFLDVGLKICLDIEIVGNRMHFSFQGTDSASDNNFNTNPAIVRSAVLYCLRLLMDSNLPLNEGVLRPVEFDLPICFLNPVGDRNELSLDPCELPAVVGGNVETSQRIVDVVLGALQVAAASQGTMNNFLFGDETFGFYETIGGGAGATAKQCGASAVHSHMTNTRLTDPEILERRYPVRLVQFSIRQASGGAGKLTGGDGMIRKFQFLRPLTVSLVTNRRGTLERDCPYGMAGGLPGAIGENWKISPDGKRQRLPASCELKVEPGEIIEIKTPGGGGWGKPLS